MKNTNLIEKVVHSILNEQHYVFETLLQEKLSDYLASIEQLLDDAGFPVSDRFSLLKKAGGITLHNAAEITVRSLLDLLYNHQDELVGETPEARYDDFISRFILNRFDEIFPVGSEVRFLVERKFSTSLELIRELLSRLKTDQDSIARQFEINIRSLDSFSMGEGDTHDNGRTVCILSLNEKEKLVYKPHSLQNDVIWGTILDWFSSNEGLKTDLRHMKVLDRGCYGWQSFVTAEPCSSQDQVLRYMYRLGVLLFISYLIGFNDLHIENIIASGEYPVVIDTETLCINRSSFEKIALDKAAPLSEVINHSVFSTLLLPTDFLSGSESANKIDTSGLFGGLEDRKPKALHIINLGRDDITFDDGEIDDDSGAESVASFRGESLNPANYIDDIIDGFHDAYDVALKNKDQLCALFDDACFSGGVFRQLMRDTELYHRYLQASYHPHYAKDRSTREMVYSKLKGKGDYKNINHQRLVESEIEQMIHDDIPYFYTQYHSLDLIPPYGNIIPGFFSSTIYQQTIDKVQSLSEKDKWLQSYFVRCAMIKDPYRPGEGNCTAIMDENTEKETRAQMIEAVAKRVFQLREYSRISDKNNTTLGYINVDHLELEGRFKQEDPGLYDGGGAALFYLQLYRVYGEKYLAPAKQMVDFTLDTLQSEKEISEQIGLFSGLGSYLYLSLQAYHVLQDDSYLVRLNDMCQKMLVSAPPKEEESDVIDGYSGMIIFGLRAYHQDPALVKLKELALRYGKRLHCMFKEDRILFQNGFSHGFSGSALAFYMLSEETADKEYYSAASDLIRRERTLFLPKTNEWIDIRFNRPGLENWCYGAGGILISRMLSLPYAEPSDRELLEEDAANCLNKLLEKTDVTTPSILCHGIAGNLDILLWYLQQRDDERVRSFLEEKTDQLLRCIVTEGVVTESAKGIIDISFMTGLSGLSYFLLRCLDHSIPSILALETM